MKKIQGIQEKTMEKPMPPAIVPETDLRNNVGPYLDMAATGREVIVTREGREVVRLLPRGAVVSFLTDALAGALRGVDRPETAREERLREKYEIAD